MGTANKTTVFVDRSIRVCVTTFMNIHSTFLYLGLSLATASPTLSYAQVTLPGWLQPTWIKAKLTDVPVKNSDRYEVTQANTNNTASTNAKQAPTNTNTNTNINTNNDVPNFNAAMPQSKLAVKLAPVETAVPKLNEKYLTAEELKELRMQLRQQR